LRALIVRTRVELSGSQDIGEDRTWSLICPHCNAPNEVDFPNSEGVFKVYPGSAAQEFMSDHLTHDNQTLPYLVRRHQAPISMRIGTRLASAKLTFLSDLSPTGGAANRQCFFLV
jgi:hypothetical protein